MSSDPAANRFPDEQALEEEHNAIRSLMAWIEADLVAESKRAEGVQGDGPLRATLRSFRDHLIQHFEFEERSGLIEAALLELPEGEAQVRKWKSAHERLARRFDELVAELETAGEESGVGPRFEDRVRRLFAELRTHDAFENAALGPERADALRASQRHRSAD